MMDGINWLAADTTSICTQFGARQFRSYCVISSDLGELHEQPSLSYLASNDAVICEHVRQIMLAIGGDTWGHMIKSTNFQSSFKIYTKTTGTYLDQSFFHAPGQTPGVRECKTSGISIDFCNILSADKTRQFRCIGLSYISYVYDNFPYVLKINAESLMPDSHNLVFTDINSVIITINQIMKEVFCNPIIPKLIGARIELLTFSEAVATEHKKKPSTDKCILFLNKKIWVRVVAVFLYTDN